MKTGKYKILLFELLLIGILLLSIIFSNNIPRIVLAIIIGIYTYVLNYLFKKRNKISAFSRQVNLYMIIFALIYLGIFYLLGLYFGFQQSKIILSFWTLYQYIIPFAIIIVCSEIIRNILLAQKIEIKLFKNKYDLSLVLTYIISVLIDFILYAGIYDLSNINNFLTITGFVLFASLSSNLLYNYISSRYSYKGLIIYRLVTILYVYIIPVIPNVYILIRTFLRIIYPFIIYLILDSIYSKKDRRISKKFKRKRLISNSILFIVMTLLIMLISCKFKYGLIVIGSGSMTGTLNIGDAIIYEEYDGKDLDIGQVIIFDYNNMQTIHRIVDRNNVNGEVRYYTKGDANPRNDDNYRIKDNINGIVKLRIKYIGKPTLWFRNLFE